MSDAVRHRFFSSPAAQPAEVQMTPCTVSGDTDHVVLTMR